MKKQIYKITMSDIKYANERSGFYYFNRSSNKFFGSTKFANPAHGPYFYVINKKAGFVTLAWAQPTGNIKNLKHFDYEDDAYAAAKRLNTRWQRTRNFLTPTGAGGHVYMNINR